MQVYESFWKIKFSNDLQFSILCYLFQRHVVSTYEVSIGLKSLNISSKDIISMQWLQKTCKQITTFRETAPPAPRRLSLLPGKLSVSFLGASYLFIYFVRFSSFFRLLFFNLSSLALKIGHFNSMFLMETNIQNFK